jgi:hypothetical protein
LLGVELDENVVGGTVVMTNPETVQLCELLTKATMTSHGKAGAIS